MDITILIERNGIRAQTSVPAQATGIEGVNRIRWVGARPKNHDSYYSLVHVMTGRALNKVPLTEDESERLIEALMDCPVQFHKIVDGGTALEYYVKKLTAEAERLAGKY